MRTQHRVTQNRHSAGCSKQPNPITLPFHSLAASACGCCRLVAIQLCALASFGARSGVRQVAWQDPAGSCLQDQSDTEKDQQLEGGTGVPQASASQEAGPRPWSVAILWAAGTVCASLEKLSWAWTLSQQFASTSDITSPGTCHPWRGSSPCCLPLASSLLWLPACRWDATLQSLQCSRGKVFQLHISSLPLLGIIQLLLPQGGHVLSLPPPAVTSSL